MRSIEKEVIVVKTVEQTEKALTEEIISKQDYTENKMLVLEVALKNANKEKIQKETYTISGEDYDFLMSDSPVFAANKLLNDYREVDLWYMIDKLRSN